MSPGSSPSAGGDGAGTPGRVYVLDGEGKPKAVSVVLGISDGSSTEVVRGELKEGQEVVTGFAGAGGGARPPSGAPRLRL